MRQLTLVGLTEDGRRVIFVDDTGAEFAAPADDKLRAALRGDRARLGQLEIEMDSVLRPRDIQARIRAGESPEAVASVAQVSVEKIMPYCVPVLAEREHVAELARRSHVRRKNVDGPARRLIEVVTERLRSRGVDPAAVQWDAWRRDDGRWSVQGSYRSGERERTALFAFDVVGRYSVADDDEAKWLTGERQSTRKGPQPREGGRGGERRLSAVPSDGDLLSLPDDEDDESNDDLTAVVRAISDSPDRETQPVTAVDRDGYPRPDVGPDTAQVDAEDEDLSAPASPAADVSVRQEGQPTTDASPHDAPESTEPVAATDPADVEPVTEPTPERKRRTNRRASIPSWDEIMLGGGGGGGGKDKGH
jgi:hypothetical protein